ncbi:hypothetical protein D3C83_174440 [compost metagenome]
MPPHSAQMPQRGKVETTAVPPPLRFTVAVGITWIIAQQAAAARTRLKDSSA